MFLPSDPRQETCYPSGVTLVSLRYEGETGVLSATSAIQVTSAPGRETSRGDYNRSRVTLNGDLLPYGILPISFRYEGQMRSSESNKYRLGHGLWYRVTLLLKLYTYMYLSLPLSIYTYMYLSLYIYDFVKVTLYPGGTYYFRFPFQHPSGIFRYAGLSALCFRVHLNKRLVALRVPFWYPSVILPACRQNESLELNECRPGHKCPSKRNITRILRLDYE